MLKGKSAVVTGSTSGIGRAIAEGLAQAGCQVMLNGFGDAAEIETLRANLEKTHGVKVLYSDADMTKPEQIDAMIEQTNTDLGGVDILVNNAGLATSHKFIDHPDELWDQIMAINLTSVYLVTKAFVPAMVAQQWGRVINIASIVAKVGQRYIAAYTASKHGVLGLTRSLALEFVADHITVNAICPGYVQTPTTETNIANIAGRTGMPAEKARAILEKVSPQNRLIQPEEVAAVALLLARESGRGITGQGINVDGGTVMS